MSGDKSLLLRAQPHGNAHFGNAGLAAGGEHGGDVLEGAVGVAPHVDVQMLGLAAGGQQPRGEVGERYGLAVQRDMTVLVAVVGLDGGGAMSAPRMADRGKGRSARLLAFGK